VLQHLLNTTQVCLSDFVLHDIAWSVCSLVASFEHYSSNDVVTLLRAIVTI
jgi:hypothetical protein